MSEWIKLHWFNLTHQPWYWGWERWEGKPWLWAGYSYYDGYNYGLHIGWLWVNCTWLGYENDDPNESSE